MRARAPCAEVLEYNARIAADRMAAIECERATAEREEKRSLDEARAAILEQVQVEREEAERRNRELRLAALEQKTAADRRQLGRLTMRGVFVKTAAPLPPAVRVAQAYTAAGKTIQTMVARQPQIGREEAEQIDEGELWLTALEQKAATERVAPSDYGKSPEIPAAYVQEPDYGPR